MERLGRNSPMDNRIGAAEDFGARIVAAIDLDYFFAQCEEVRKPELAGSPVVICVYSGRTQDSGAVSTCNYVARGLGVRSGIPILSAKRMLKEHPEAAFLPIDKEYYESVSERVMDVLRSEGDRFEQVSIDEAFLDVTIRCQGDYRRAEQVGARIKGRIRDIERLTCSVGISSNKLIAKMAADECKPNGLLLVPPEGITNFLRDKPVGKLPGIGPKSEAKLASLGVRTLGELGLIDGSKLIEQFGRNLGPHLKRSALGIDNDPVREKEVEQFSRIITLKHDTKEFDFQEELLPLAEDIATRMKASNVRCRSVGIIAITTKLSPKSRSHTLKEATGSGQVIFREACELFRSFFSEAKESTDVRRVGVRVSALERGNGPEQEKSGSGPSLTDYI